MSSSDKTPGSGGTILPSANVVPRRPLWRLLSLLVLLLAVLSGVYAAITLRLHWRSSAAQPPVAATLQRDFQGEAFGEEATVDALRLEAEQSVERLLERYPRLVPSHYVQAHFSLLLEQGDEAANAWRRCLDLDSDNADAYVSLATLELQNGRHTEAVRLLRQAMACPTQDVRVPGLLADALVKQGEIDEAIALLERQIRKQQGSGAAVTLLGQCYLQKKEYERAKTMLQVAVTAMPQSAAAHYGLAQACQRLKQQDLAQEHMALFQELSRADRASHAEGAKTYNDVSVMRGIVAETLVDVGRVYLEQGDVQAAEETLLKASVFDEQDQDCWELLARLFEQTQDFGKGLLAWQRLCEINPDNSEYWLNVAVLSGRLLRRDEGLAAIEKAMSLSPNDPECRRVYEILHNRS